MYETPLAKWFARIAMSFGAATLLALSTVVGASCDNDAECDDISAWTVFTRVTLRQSVSGSAEAIDWLGSFDHQALDASIDIATHGSTERMAGTVALVGGQVMLTRGLKLQPGYEIDALDAPVLSMRLVMILLKRIFPKGPNEIVEPTNLDRTDPVGIKYATPSAGGYIPAPWQVKGAVSKLSDNTIRFDLALSFQLDRQDKQLSSVTIGMKGELAVLGRPVFRDADSLDGWTTYGLGPQQSKQGNNTVLDYGAKPQESSRYRSIGDVRAFIAAENHPGTRDATRDFTGFWKKKCDDPFGLQIRHYGNDGKYSIVFCGPGGCGDPSQSRLTFITGDKRYEVVGEGEFMEIARSGDRETYHRCTKDTNPVLKYQ